MTARLLTHIVALIGLLLATGCGASGVDKAGGERRGEVTTLTFANGNGDLGELRVWVEQVERMSKGRLRIRSVNAWRDGEPGYEVGLIGDVRAGRADLGWAGTRAWATVGVRSLDAMHAPLLVDSYAVQEEILRGAAAEQMLAGVAGAGVQPVALLPGPMRLLLTRSPVERPEDLRGIDIAVQASEVGEQALRALGARPVAIARGASIAGHDGVEQQVDSSLGNGYLRQARYLTADVPLWPRPPVIFANQAAWRALTDDQRGILREAAARALPEMLHNLEASDQRGMDGLCRGGVRAVTVGSQGIEALRLAVEPVVAALRRRPETRGGLEAVERARADAGGAAQLACPSATEPGSRAAGLTGAFTTTFRRTEPGADILNDFESGADRVRFDLELRDGRAVITETFPDDSTIIGFDEPYTVYRDRISLGGDTGPPITARWELEGDRLRFTEIAGAAAPGDRFVWGAHAWVRTGR